MKTKYKQKINWDSWDAMLYLLSFLVTIGISLSLVATFLYGYFTNNEKIIEIVKEWLPWQVVAILIGQFTTRIFYSWSLHKVKA